MQTTRITVALILFILSMQGASAWMWLNYTIPNPPQYETPYTREGNFTIHIPLPGVLRGITPRLIPPQQLKYDTTVHNTTVNFDTLDCETQIAQCYQIRLHNSTIPITSGKNYSAASQYTLPERRVKAYLCVGNDTKCVADSVGCSCVPQVRPPIKAEYLRKPGSACTYPAHICRDSTLGLTLCKGNFTSCTEEHGECACGRHNTCLAGTLTTCVNERQELILCKAGLNSCLEKYSTCFCGSDVMRLQATCDTMQHQCVNQGNNVTCRGTFNECALKHDRCTC